MRALSGPTGLVLAILASLGLLVGLWFGYTAREVHAHQATRDAITAANTKTSSYQHYLDEIRAPGGTDHLGAIYTRVQAADALLPTAVDAGHVTATLPSVVSDAGLTLGSLDPGTDGKNYSDYKLTVSGSYDDLTAWLTQMQSYPELVTVGQLTLTPASSTPGASSSAAPASAASGALSATLDLRFWTSPQSPLTATGAASASGGAAG